MVLDVCELMIWFCKKKKKFAKLCENFGSFAEGSRLLYSLVLLVISPTLCSLELHKSFPLHSDATLREQASHRGTLPRGRTRVKDNSFTQQTS